jgi:hypothetical protein
VKFATLAFGGLATFLLAGSAFGQGGYDELGSFQHHTEHESEQTSAIEARMGPYRPDVDDAVAGTPFDDIFGKTRYAVGLEYDWQLLRIPAVGTLGPGVGASYVRYSAKAPLASTGERSGQDTRLWILPVWGVGVLRVDTLARNFKIPLVPYGKLGLVYALWNCSTGGNRCRSSDGTLGRGTETGYMYAAGLMLLLDWLDPASAKEMDNSVGVNNSYFFGEFWGSDVNSFGDGMQVGTKSWTLGLAFEF